MRTGTISGAACATLLSASGVDAGPRDEPELAEASAIETPDLTDWMERIRGRFTIDGVHYHVEYIEPPLGGVSVPYNERSKPVAEGKADCVGFADGPGLQCVIHISWTLDEGILPGTDPEWIKSTEYAAGQVLMRSFREGGMGGYSNLKPAMILVGLAPSSPGAIRFLLVDDLGTANPGSLALRGNAAITKPPCVNLPGKLFCGQIFRVEAKPDAKVIFLTFGIRTEFLRSRGEPGFSGLGRAPERVEEILELSLALHREPQTAKETEQELPR